MIIVNLYICLDSSNTIVPASFNNYVNRGMFINKISDDKCKRVVILNKNTNKMVFTELGSEILCGSCAVRKIHSRFLKHHNINNHVTCSGFGCAFKKIEMLDSIYKLLIFMTSLIRYNKINLVYLTYFDEYGKEIQAIYAYR